MQSGEANPNWKGGKTIRFCKTCGTRVARNNKTLLCRPCSRKGSANSFYGKKHSEETRAKMVISQGLRDPSTRKHVVGDPVAHSEWMKERWENMTPEQKEKSIKPFIEAGLVACKQSRRTKIEVLVDTISQKYASDIIPNHQIGKFNVDLLINGTHIIECYGDYWHCNPTVYEPSYYNQSLKLTSQQKWEKDENRNKELTNKGYYVLCLWEKDIKNAPAQIEEKIITFLTGTPCPDPLPYLEEK